MVINAIKAFLKAGIKDENLAHFGWGAWLSLAFLIHHRPHGLYAVLAVAVGKEILLEYLLPRIFRNFIRANTTLEPIGHSFTDLGWWLVGIGAALLAAL